MRAADSGPSRRKGDVPTGLAVVLALLGLLLHQTLVVGDVNTSAADLVMLAALAALVARPCRIPVGPTLAFLAVLTTTAANAVFLVPAIFGIYVNPASLLRDVSKLVIAFFFLIVGYALFNTRGLDLVVQWYSRAGIAIAGVGAVWSITNLSLLRDSLFLWNIRYRGMVADPNLCAMLLICAMPYFLRGDQRRTTKVAAIAILMGGVISTGSKTGMGIATIYVTVSAIRSLWNSARRETISAAASLIALGAFALLAVVAFRLSAGAWDWPLAQSLSGNAGATRAFQVLEDPLGALDESGSGRSSAFSTAISIISLAPLVGVGVGPYSEVALELSGSPTIAHNTYLQIASEWGIPLAFCFFGATVTLVAIAWKAPYKPIAIAVSSDIVFILLAGGLAISLNNVRVFWLALGALYAFATSRDSEGGARPVPASGVGTVSKVDRRGMDRGPGSSGSTVSARSSHRQGRSGGAC